MDAGDGVDVVAVERFHAAHEAAYGYRLPDAVVEFVHVGAVAADHREVPPDPPPPAGPPGEPHAVRPVCFEEWLDTPIYQRAVLAAGQRVDGPAVDRGGRLHHRRPAGLDRRGPRRARCLVPHA